MNTTRMLKLAAAFGITVAQWTLCLSLFFFNQPVTAANAKPAATVAQENLPEIVVIGHRS